MEDRLIAEGFKKADNMRKEKPYLKELVNKDSGDTILSIAVELLDGKFSKCFLEEEIFIDDMPQNDVVEMHTIDNEIKFWKLYELLNEINIKELERKEESEYEKNVKRNLEKINNLLNLNDREKSLEVLTDLIENRMYEEAKILLGKLTSIYYRDSEIIRLDRMLIFLKDKA